MAALNGDNTPPPSVPVPGSTLLMQPLLLADANTERNLNADPDLGGMTKNYGPAPSPAPTTSQPLGNDPTRRVTQEEYDEQLRGQKAAQEKAYQEYKNRRRR
jgi:hypothetical protein